MDISDYVNNQADRLSAALTAYALTSPVVETAADLYRTVKDYLGPEAMAVMGLAATRFGPDAMDMIAQSMGAAADPGLHMALDPIKDPAIDAATDVADSYAMAGKREQEYLKPEQDAIAQDPAKLEADKQEAAKLEAQWAAQQQVDEQDRLSRQQEADQKVADRLDEALRKDQEFRQQEQADKAALEQPAQEQNKEEQVQDPRLAAQAIDHKEKLEKFDKDIADRLATLEKNHVGDPALPGLCEKFNSAAADARTKMVDQQTAERTQLQDQVFAERQNPIQPAQPPRPAPPPPVINDPSRTL
jgi:hypothetical protein